MNKLNKISCAALFCSSVMIMGGCATKNEIINNRSSEIIPESHNPQSYLKLNKEVKEILILGDELYSQVGGNADDGYIFYLASVKMINGDNEVHTIILNRYLRLMASVSYKKSDFDLYSKDIIAQTKVYQRDVTYPHIAIGAKAYQDEYGMKMGIREVDFNKNIKEVTSSYHMSRDTGIIVRSADNTANSNDIIVYSRGDKEVRFNAPIGYTNIKTLKINSCKEAIISNYDKHKLASEPHNGKITNIDTCFASSLMPRDISINATEYFENGMMIVGAIIFFPITVPAFLFFWGSSEG